MRKHEKVWVGQYKIKILFLQKAPTFGGGEGEGWGGGVLKHFLVQLAAVNKL
jgi:hypothetical protein